MSLISRGQAALNSWLTTAAGVSITYTRGAQSTTLTAWVGRTAFARTSSEPGAALIWGERDYLIPVASLTLGGTGVVPTKGDRITQTIDGADVVYELMAMPGEPLWRYSDPTRTVYRVHCKRVA